MDAVKFSREGEGTSPPTNYLEIWFMQPRNTEDTAEGKLNTHISKEVFYKVLEAWGNKRCNIVDTKFHQYYDMVLQKTIENGEVVDTRLYKDDLVDYETSHDDKLLSLYFHRKKIATALFPSTSSLHRIVYRKKITFKIALRAYLCMVQEKEEASEDVYYRIYIHYNHVKDADVEQHCHQIQNVITSISQTMVSTSSQ